MTKVISTTKASAQLDHLNAKPTHRKLPSGWITANTPARGKHKGGIV
jgi:hypothetical protein